VSTCPQAILTLKTFSEPVEVLCSSHDKGPAAKKLCKNACIGCGLCMRNCSHGAIKIDNFVAVVDGSKCAECTESTCLAKCPTGAIQAVIDNAAVQKTA
jgi:ferredoxin